MDGKYPKNIDPRPKRRKAKENPYEIFSVGKDTEDPHFYVSFKDSRGVLICTEITRALFDMLNQFELEDLAYLNEVDRHIDKTEISSDFLERLCSSKEISPDEEALKRIRDTQLHEAIYRLPNNQRRRLILYHFHGHTYEEIAKMEGCTPQAVRKSILAAHEKPKHMMK